MGKYKDIKVDENGNPEFDLSGKHEFQKLTDQREWFDYEYGVRYEVTKRPSHSMSGDTSGLMAKPSNLEEMHYWVGDFMTISENKIEAKYRLNYRGENWLFTFTASEPYTISRAYAVPFTLNIEKERKSK